MVYENLPSNPLTRNKPHNDLEIASNATGFDKTGYVFGFPRQKSDSFFEVWNVDLPGLFSWLRQNCVSGDNVIVGNGGFMSDL